MSQNNDAKFVTRKIGLAAVIEELDLRVPSPAVSSTVAAGARKTRVEGSAVYEQYPKTYAADTTVNLKNCGGLEFIGGGDRNRTDE